MFGCPRRRHTRRRLGICCIPFLQRSKAFTFGPSVDGVLCAGWGGRGPTPDGKIAVPVRTRACGSLRRLNRRQCCKDTVRGLDHSSTAPPGERSPVQLKPGSQEPGQAAYSGADPSEDECFLAAAGAEYCVTSAEDEQQPQPQEQESLESSVSIASPRDVAGQSVALQGSSAQDGAGILDKRMLPLSVMMGLCFSVAIVCALDRVAMSVAIVPMGLAYEYSDTTKGLISSIFSWGYMASIIPSSVLIGVLGPKATMAGGVLVWSAAQMLSPSAAGVSLPALLACRFAMGAGEAVTMPSIQAIVSESVPPDQRSGWLSLIISGLQIGTVLAYLATPLIIDAWDWKTVFLVYGVLGLMWLALWVPLMPDRTQGGVRGSNDGYQLPLRSLPVGQPASALSVPPPVGESTLIPTVPVLDEGLRKRSKSTADGEYGTANLATVPQRPSGPTVEPRASPSSVANGSGGVRLLQAESVLVEGCADQANREASPRGLNLLEGFKDVPWRRYLTNGQIWSISSAHMAHNWGLYVMLAWLPTYFSQEFDLSLGQSSSASVIPWLAGAITGNMAGWGADALVKKGILDVRSVRKVFQTVALVGPAVCMLALSQGPETSSQASLLFTVAVALGSCSSAGFGSSVQDLRSKDTGVIYGMSSAYSAVIGSAGVYLTGVVLDTTDSWVLVFQVTAAVYVIGAAIYGGLYRAEPLDPC